MEPGKTLTELKNYYYHEILNNNNYILNKTTKELDDLKFGSLVNNTVKSFLIEKFELPLFDIEIIDYYTRFLANEINYSLYFSPANFTEEDISEVEENFKTFLSKAEGKYFNETQNFLGKYDLILKFNDDIIPSLEFLKYLNKVSK